MAPRLFLLTALSLTSLAGCSGGAVPPPSPTPPPPRDSAPPASAAASAVVPTPSAAPTAAPAAAPSSPFAVVARLADPERSLGLRLTGVDGAGFVLGMPTIIKIEDKGLLRDPSLSKGLPIEIWRAYLADLTGRWPDALFANVVATNGRVGIGETYRWNGTEWRPVRAPLTPAWVYVGISPWSEGRTLALTRNTMAFNPRADVRFALLSGPPAKLPEFTQITPPPSATKGGFAPCRISLDPTAFLALPSGHVFAAGHPCDDERHLVVEWWAPGKTKSTVEVLPLDSPPETSFDEELSFYARSSDDVYLVAGSPKTAGPTLLHFDGGAWKSVKVPVSSRLSSIAGLPDGTIFVTAPDAGQIWRRAPDGAWTSMDLPILSGEKRMMPNGVWARSAAEIWVTTGGAVLNTSAPTGPAEVWKTDDAPPPGSAGKQGPVRAASPSCKTVFALLYTLARTAPEDYDFPQTRAALKGLVSFKDATFVETEDRGRRYFGAFVPSYEVGVKLVKTLSDKVPGSAPQLLCAEPKVRRTIKIDLRTGDLVK